MSEVEELMAVVRMGINTHQEPIAYMHKDCHICRSEGFNASSRLSIKAGSESLIVTLNVVDNDSIDPGKVGLSDIAMERMQLEEGDLVSVGFAPFLKSLSAVRKKIYGHSLNESDFLQVVADISNHNYRDIEIASFLSVCAGGRLNIDEIIGLTRAMVACGKRLSWPNQDRVFDKHCIGGLPGNRTTPIVVAIASAAGLAIPKTSSRAITSPAGTADVLETLFNVKFSIADMQRIVSNAGACLVWGGAVNLSPADDLLIRIERALDLDGEGQLIASVLSKKIAAGSTHTVIDIPVGPTAKVRTTSEADSLAELFTRVGQACGILVRCVITDGTRPVGFGIGPSQEAIDVLRVLKADDEAPQDLCERALFLSANLIDMASSCGVDSALEQANALLKDGQAWDKFQQIANEQGGMKPVPEPAFASIETAKISGIVGSIDNRKLARLAKLAGAPAEKTAGLRLHISPGQKVAAGEALFTLFSGSSGELAYARSYLEQNRDLISISGDNDAYPL